MGRPWTADELAERLVDAFRRLHGRPILADGGEFLDLATGETIRAGEFVRAARALLDDPDRAMLLAWANARASGIPIAQLCRDRGWSEDTVARARLRACDHLAKALAALSKIPIDRADGREPHTAQG